jgi:hypothetical protein
MKVDENRTMTVLLGIMARSFIMLVCWLLAGPKDITFGKDGIRKELLSRQQKY